MSTGLSRQVLAVTEKAAICASLHVMCLYADLRTRSCSMRIASIMDIAVHWCVGAACIYQSRIYLQQFKNLLWHM